MNFLFSLQFILFICFLYSTTSLVFCNLFWACPYLEYSYWFHGYTWESSILLQLEAFWMLHLETRLRWSSLYMLFIMEWFALCNNLYLVLSCQICCLCLDVPFSWVVLFIIRKNRSFRIRITLQSTIHLVGENLYLNIHMKDKIM